MMSTSPLGAARHGDAWTGEISEAAWNRTKYLRPDLDDDAVTPIPLVIE